MMGAGAHVSHRSDLARLSRAARRAAYVVRESRAMARERREALGYFHEDLGLRPGASVQDVLDAIAVLRGRRVQPLQLSSLPPTVSGIAVLGTDDHGVDYIGITDRISRRHQAHVLLHEVRHLHPGGSEADAGQSIAVHFDGVTLESLREQMSGLPDHIRQEILTRPVRLRAGYGHEEERRCEIFARVVLPLLDLDSTSQRTGSLTSAFSNRRSL